MSFTANINLNLEFEQVLELVKQLPAGKKRQLIDMLEKEEKKPNESKSSK